MQSQWSKAGGVLIPRADINVLCAVDHLFQVWRFRLIVIYIRMLCPVAALLPMFPAVVLSSISANKNSYFSGIYNMNFFAIFCAGLMVIGSVLGMQPSQRPGAPKKPQSAISLYRPKPQNVQCSFCTYTTSSQSALSLHVVTTHADNIHMDEN